MGSELLIWSVIKGHINQLSPHVGCTFKQIFFMASTMSCWPYSNSQSVAKWLACLIAYPLHPKLKQWSWNVSTAVLWHENWVFNSILVFMIFSVLASSCVTRLMISEVRKKWFQLDKMTQDDQKRIKKWWKYQNW